MPKALFLATAMVVLLEPTLVSAQPNPQQCLRLRRIFDACESAQIKQHKPVFPRCKQQWDTLKKAGCA